MNKFEKKDQDWFDENDYENPLEIEFANIYYANKDVILSKDELDNYKPEEDAPLYETAIIVDGNLTIDGFFGIADGNLFIVSGDVKCETFFGSDEGYLECEKLIVEKFADCTNLNSIESLDVRVIKSKIVSSFDDCENFNGKIETEFMVDEEVNDDNFEDIYTKLKE